MSASADSTVADSTVRETSQDQEGTPRRRRWGLGVRIGQPFGLSVRYALTERFTAQVAGFPIPVGEGEISAGGQMLYKLYAEPTHNFYIAGGGAVFREGTYTNPFTEESQRDRGYTLSATLGGEYRFSQRLGLGGGAGLTYLVQHSAVLDRNEVLPAIELDLHYYF